MTKKERNQLIWERYQEGYSQEEIGEIYNLSQSAVSLIIVKKERNIPEPKQETRGAKLKLTTTQLSELRKVLSHDPISIIGSSHWNKKSIQALIEKKFGVHYHENYIWKLIKKIGFSSQIPQQKDYRQDQDQVQDFKLNRIPAIKKAIAENRMLAFQDESAVRLLPGLARSYAPIGRPPVMLCDTKNKDYFSISGAIISNGQFYFEVREQEVFKREGLTRFLTNCRKN